MYPYQANNVQPYITPVMGDELKVVNGIDSARQYPMRPNARTILLDGEQDMFYLLTSDATGMTSIKTYRFEEVPQPKPINANDYVTKDELKEVLNEFFTKQQPTEKQLKKQPAPQF